MINVERLSKSYGRKTVLTDVSLEVGHGEWLGVVGAHDSGCSTLLQILATLVPPTSGTVRIDGVDIVKDVYRVRPRLAYVGKQLVGPGQMRVGDYLRFVFAARGAPARGTSVGDAIARAGLDQGELVDALPPSGRQRVELTAALMLQPAVLLVDDPFRALDDAARLVFTRWMAEARDRGAMLVLTAGSEAEMPVLANRVARLDAGRLVSPARTNTAAHTKPACAAVEA